MRLFEYVFALGISKALAVTASAGFIGCVVGACNQEPYAVRPPAKYTQGRKSVILTIGSQLETTHSCQDRGLHAKTIACANTSEMFLPNPCDYQGSYAEIVCHEYGHTLGWGVDHPTE
ncbi:MAG: hypothetical protein ACRDBG_28245 [Waterburya sp.]